MSKVTLTDLASLTNEQSAILNINNNNDAVEVAFDNTLSRDGSTPNAMEADLDMNSNHILNLPAPNGVTEPVRVADLQSAIAQVVNGELTNLFPSPTLSDVDKVPRVSGTGIYGLSTVLVDTSSNIKPIVSGVGSLGQTSNSWANLFLSAGAIFNFNNGDVTVTHLANQLNFAGASFGYSFDNALYPSNSTTVTLGKNTNQFSDLFLKTGATINFNNSDVIFTHSAGNLALTGNQTISGTLAVVGNSTLTGATSIGGSLTVAGPSVLTGVIDGSSAISGQVGEFITASATAVSLTTATSVNITSISLTAGDWDVRGSIGFTAAATTSITRLNGGISSTTLTLPASNTTSLFTHAAAAYVPNVSTTGYSVGPTRISISTTTTIFLVAQATFTVAALTGNGVLEARRVR